MRSRSRARRLGAWIAALAAMIVVATACGSGGSGAGPSGLPTRSASHSPIERPSAEASLAPPPAAATAPSVSPSTVPASSSPEPTTPRATLPSRNPSRAASPVPSPASVVPPLGNIPSLPSPGPSTSPAQPTPPTSSAAAPAVPTPSITPTTAGNTTPWGWLIAGLALLAAVIIGALVGIRRRKARQHWLAWRHDAEPALGAAMIARDLLPEGVNDIVDLAHWRSVQDQTEQAARGLESVAATGPSKEATSAAHATAQALRNVVFALEAERLLTASTRPPTAEQLGAAAANTRSRRSELDAGIGQLTQIVSPQPQPPS